MSKCFCFGTVKNSRPYHTAIQETYNLAQLLKKCTQPQKVLTEKVIVELNFCVSTLFLHRYLSRQKLWVFWRNWNSFFCSAFQPSTSFFKETTDLFSHTINFFRNFWLKLFNISSLILESRIFQTGNKNFVTLSL